MSAHSNTATDRSPAARETPGNPMRRDVLLGGAGISLGAAFGTSGLLAVTPAAALRITG